MIEKEDKKEEEKLEFTLEGESLGYIGLDQARVLAIVHARDHTDFYGPRYAGVRLAWEVLSTEESEDYYDIRLSFRPVDRFRGEPGLEHFIFDKTGELQMRQVLDGLPELDLPAKKGLRLRLLSAVGLSVLVVGGMFAAFVAM